MENLEHVDQHAYLLRGDNALEQPATDHRPSSNLAVRADQSRGWHCARGRVTTS